MRLSERTGNLLLEFDQSVIGEPSVLALMERDRPARSPAPRAPSASSETGAAVRDGWRRAERVEMIQARPAACIAALTDFERYPEWQSYLTAVTILARDARGRGVRVASRAQVGERETEFTINYGFPSPNRITFHQGEGELEAVHGSWVFRSVGGGRTRATYVIEVKPGWRLSVLLRGPLYEQIRDAVLDHVMSELRSRVES
ncbi:MAG: SRPBCC family protein [Solirubrobacteraceae bacterium]